MATLATGVQLPAAEALMAEARAATGIELVDDAVREPLGRLLRSLNGEGRLHEAGARGMHERLVLLLSNRLRMQRDFAAHPEIADEVIDRPIFVCGMGRTGSTKTQKLLAASGDFNWLPYWKTLTPSLFSGDRGEPPQPRIDTTDRLARWFDAASPETKFGHAFETHEPEEDSPILEHSFQSPVFMGWAPLNSYLDWLLTQDMTAQFVYLRDTLKYLQWQGLAERGKRWVLKSPLYSGLEQTLLGVFPDAALLMTHRHPDKTIASGLKLMENFYKPYTDARPEPAYYVQGQAGAADAHLRCRAALPEGTFHDVDFNRLMADLRGELRRIYAFVGERASEESLDRMIAWDEASPADKYGRHVYTMEEFGLTRDGLEQAFAGYIAFLDQRFPKTA